MDTITLAGPIEARLRAVREGGFTQIMLSARDLVEHPGGEAAAISAVRRSGLRVTGFQVLRDFEGLPGHLHAYKLDIAKAMLGMCRALGSKILLACSSTSTHASGDPEALSRDLRKLATLAVPLGIRVAYEALSWGKHVNEFPRAWEIVAGADRANLGLALDYRPARRLHVAGIALARGAHQHREALPRVSRRRRARGGSGRARAQAGRHGLSRRLQLRGVQRRLHPAARSPGGGPCPAIGQVADRPRVPPQPSDTQDGAVDDGARLKRRCPTSSNSPRAVAPSAAVAPSPSRRESCDLASAFPTPSRRAR